MPFICRNSPIIMIFMNKSRWYQIYKLFCWVISIFLLMWISDRKWWLAQLPCKLMCDSTTLYVAFKAHIITVKPLLGITLTTGSICIERNWPMTWSSVSLLNCCAISFRNLQPAREAFNITSPFSRHTLCTCFGV